ncbi:hypothetical protein KIN20_019060 [Parelaphostrongylus tenuis]|uniref:Uncharacterized protein n=1 Tax=Parelaphostrongylus tenuis TaxID=148309 RepID=A0AAD5QQ08_PARTN|nr:hypothetical protein KIN20_019060 [Parelaphostrongylus tenuis]
MVHSQFANGEHRLAAMINPLRTLAVAEGLQSDLVRELTACRRIKWNPENEEFHLTVPSYVEGC